MEPSEALPKDFTLILPVTESVRGEEEAIPLDEHFALAPALDARGDLRGCEHSPIGHGQRLRIVRDLDHTEQTASVQPRPKAGLFTVDLHIRNPDGLIAYAFGSSGHIQTFAAFR